MTQVQMEISSPVGTSIRHEPVFLLAPARSFSTVTVALLAGHPDIYGFPEMVLFTADTVGQLLEAKPKPGQPVAWPGFQRSGILRAVADLLEASQEEHAIQHAEKWLAERSAWSPPQLMDCLLELAYPQIGLEKSPETVRSAKALDACLDRYPNARYIHLTRHPVTTMRSMLNHWGRYMHSQKATIVYSASSWYLSHTRIVRRLAQLPPHQSTRVRAEDLLREPDTHLPQLLNWLGLPSDRRIVSQMKHTENWRFANTGPSGKLFGGDPKFLLSPALRPIPEPGEILFTESWGLLDEMRARMTALAMYLGY